VGSEALDPLFISDGFGSERVPNELDLDDWEPEEPRFRVAALEFDSCVRYDMD